MTHQAITMKVTYLINFAKHHQKPIQISSLLLKNILRF